MYVQNPFNMKFELLVITLIKCSPSVFFLEIFLFSCGYKKGNKSKLINLNTKLDVIKIFGNGESKHD